MKYEKLTELAGWDRLYPRSSVVFGHVSLALKSTFQMSFVRGAEELLQGLVLGRIELPQIASPALARKDPAKKHHLDHIDKLDVLVDHTLDVHLQRC